MNVYVVAGTPMLVLGRGHPCGAASNVMAFVGQRAADEAIFVERRGRRVEVTEIRFLYRTRDPRGWPELMGREPTERDLIIPSRRGKNRGCRLSLVRFHEDLERLGLRERRQHDLRRTFISLARADGARADVLEEVTHAKRGDIMNLYTELPWALLCEAVSCLHVTIPGGPSPDDGPAASRQPSLASNPDRIEPGPAHGSS